jgi:CRISPR-associated protein Csb3
MSEKEPNITIPVDPTNPGQFFACCGLLELADRLWPGVEGWFERREFCILTEDRSKALSELLNETKLLRFDVGDDSEAEDDADETDDKSPPIEPIRLQWKNEKPAIDLDWWSERSIKPWAGSMKERVILRAMLDAIDPKCEMPFSDLKRVQYQSPKLQKNGKLKKPAKKEPFYFDPRRGSKSHPLDSGFSPDTHKMEAECCPALEALCFIGLQRARPAATGTANQSRYTVWTKHSLADPGLPVSLLGAVTSGIVPWPTFGNYVFDNYFRTDQRKHKTFSQATLERSTNV